MRMDEMINDIRKCLRYFQADGVIGIEYDEDLNLQTVLMTEKGFLKKFNKYETIRSIGVPMARRVEQGILFTAYLREEG